MPLGVEKDKLYGLSSPIGYYSYFMPLWCGLGWCIADNESMSILGTTIAQSMAGAPAAERAARPIGPPSAKEVGRGKGALHSRDDDEDIDSVQVSDEARSLKDAADEETRQERRGHEFTPAPPHHGHEIEGDDEPLASQPGPLTYTSAGVGRHVHIDIQA